MSLGGRAARLATLATMMACASSAPPRVAISERLQGTDGASHAIVPALPDVYTVLIFFSSECHVLAAHDERVRALAAAFVPRQVRFLGVDAEVGATLERDRAEAERRRYPFPILLDRQGGLAHAFGATFAGYVVVIDRQGAVRFQGGIDSDRVRLREEATPYLRDALADLLAGKPPRVAESKALGCALRLR